MSRVLVLAGGSPHAHDFPAIGAAIAELATERGYATEVARDPDEAASRLDPSADGDAFDALVINGLWWRMEGDAYDPWRDDYAYSAPECTRRAIDDFVSGGGGLVALHTTPICFDDWPEWRDIVGGSWKWGSSSHPPYGPVSAEIVAEHAVVDGVGPRIELHDEVYGELDIRDDVEVLAVARRHPDDADQPVVWTYQRGKGRVVFDGFGHDADSVAHPANRTIISQAIDWVVDDTGGDSGGGSERGDG